MFSKASALACAHTQPASQGYIIHATSLNRTGGQGSSHTSQPDLAVCHPIGHSEKSADQNKHSSVVLAYLPDRKLLPDQGGARVEGQTSTHEVLNTLRHGSEAEREREK